MLQSQGARSSARARWVLLLVWMLWGCRSLGPQTIPVDRFDYSTAIADSMKQQTLLNIVKLRYMDLPVFVDVASVVSGYALESAVSATGAFTGGDALGNTGTLSGSAKLTDRPTITYVPMTGEKFLRGLITPIDPKNIFFMLQSGYAADFILGLTVESLNGVRNRSAIAGSLREADPDFIRALQLLREVQAAGAFGMRVEEDARGATGIIFFSGDDPSPEILEKTAEIRRLLKLDPDQKRFNLRYSPMRGEANELSVNSRSMLQILGAFASYIEVPTEHLNEHSALPAPGPNPDSGVRIRSAKERPSNVFTAVRYRDYWFWIDVGDLQTKRAVTAVTFLFTLAETGAPEPLPLITIPAQ